MVKKKVGGMVRRFKEALAYSVRPSARHTKPVLI